jgi:hypothetical protein
MGTNLQAEFSLANLDALFKNKYLKYYENVFNTSTPLWNKIQKTNNFVGKKLEFPVPTSYKGGVGSGSLPETANADYGDVQITSKKVYATDRVDRESIMAASSDEGAFVKAMAECIKKTVEADVWNHNRILFGNGDGSLGTIKASAGVTDNGTGNYSLIIGEAASTFKEANFEENMFVNFASGTDLFEIQSVTPSTRTIVVQRQAGGSDVPVESDVCYLQGSKDNDPHGLKNVLDATSSTLYNVTVGRKWQAYQEDVTTGISTDLMNKVMTRIEKKVGTPPNLIVTSYAQYEKLLNLMEDQKRYDLVSVKPKGYEGVKGVMSFSGVQFMSSRGAINIFPDKFCEDDRMYFLNTDHIVYFRRPNSGWVKEDIGGNGYLRVVDEDKFEARLATYGQIFIAPTFHGRIKGLTS